MSKAVEKSHEARPALHASLLTRLAAGRDAAEEAWSAKASTSFKEAVAAVVTAVREFDVRAPEIRSEEDMRRIRAEFAEVLRTASVAVAPRTI